MLSLSGAGDRQQDALALQGRCYDDLFPVIFGPLG